MLRYYFKFSYEIIWKALIVFKFPYQLPSYTMSGHFHSIASNLPLIAREKSQRFKLFIIPAVFQRQNTENNYYKVKKT